MYKLNLSNQAEIQLDALQEYADSRYFSKRLMQLDDEFERCFERLRKTPYFYQQCTQPKLETKKYRRAIVQDFIIVYQVDDENLVVNIIAAFHGRQNYAAYL